MKTHYYLFDFYMFIYYFRSLFQNSLLISEIINFLPGVSILHPERGNN